MRGALSFGSSVLSSISVGCLVLPFARPVVPEGLCLLPLGMSWYHSSTRCYGSMVPCYVRGMAWNHAMLPTYEWYQRTTCDHLVRVPYVPWLGSLRVLQRGT